MIKNNPELLAPAGGMAQLKAAVQSGADAVYLGASAFSARAGAGNFSYSELKEAVKYCHIYGVKVHCALNTLIKENEFASATNAAREIYRCGVDAFIIQDLGLAAWVNENLPEVEMHASTQMTVTSIEGVKYLEKHGFSRVVLARELSIEDIKKIVKDTKVEIEVFVHGSICMSYSGQCLMSSMLGGRSGNRGRCAQPCRLQYEISGRHDKKYILSPKDMALINHLEELKAAGVASLKIEGRLKSAEYVSAVTGVYRKYLNETKKAVDKDYGELVNAFSRSGFTDGYLTGRIGKNMMAHDNPANNSGSSYTAEAKERAEGKYIKKIPINMYVSLLKGDVLRVTANDEDNNYVSAEGSVIAEKAINKPLTDEVLKMRISKLGETPFDAVEISIELDDGVIIPAKEINEVRRKICAELEDVRGGIKPRKEIEREQQAVFRERKTENIYLSAEVCNIEQGRAVLKTEAVKRIYAPPEIAGQLAKEANGAEIVSKTADIFHKEKISTDSVSVSSTAAEYYYGKKAKYGDFRLNIYNSHTIRQLLYFKCLTLSPELNLNEIAEVAKNAGDSEVEIIGYGRIPLMVMRNCPLKAMGVCQQGKNLYLLKDRKNIEFPIMCSDRKCGECKAILLNSKPIYAADIMESIKKTQINCIRLNFTVEKSEQCGKIVYEYKNALDGMKCEKPEENSFTRGHFKRGVL